MYTSVINIKTEPETKKKAQAIAAEIGVSLSSLINAYLKNMIRTKKVEFNASEVPSAYLVKTIKKAEKNFKEGKGSPIFKTGEEAVKWLHEQGI